MTPPESPAEIIAREIQERLTSHAALIAKMDEARQRFHERRADKSDFPIFPNQEST